MGLTCSFKPETLLALLGGPDWPKIVDVRRSNVFDMAADVLPTAVWRNHREASAWCPLYRDVGPVVVYCAHGEQVSQAAATTLRASGIDAFYLESGISGWLACRGATLSREKQTAIRRAGPSRWVASDTPRIDQLACIWLIRRFIDADAGIHFVANGLSAAVAQEIGAIPIAMVDPSLPSAGATSAFDTLIRHFDIADPCLDCLATLVRCGDSQRNAMPAETPGLIALAAGLIARARDEREMLDDGLKMFDALYLWARKQDQGAAGEASTIAKDAS